MASLGFTRANLRWDVRDDREGSEPELQGNVYVHKLSIAWELVGNFRNKWDLWQSPASSCPLTQGNNSWKNPSLVTAMYKPMARINQQHLSRISHDGKLALEAPQSNKVQWISKNRPTDFTWCLQSNWSLLPAFILLDHLPRGCFYLHQLPEVIKKPCLVLPALSQGALWLQACLWLLANLFISDS